MVANVGVQQLEMRLNDVKAQQGVVAKIWNGVKEVFSTGSRESQCESMVEDFKNGKISFEAALEYINDFEVKQKNSAKLISNIATGTASIVAATTTAGVSIPVGMAVGAISKTGINFFERATNKVKGDALDGGEILKDIATGAVVGGTSAAPSHIFQGIKEASVAKTLVNGSTCGLACGSVSGVVDYMSDVMFDDKKFNFGDLTKHTLTSALVSGSVGAVVGGAVYGIERVLGHVGKEVSRSTAQQVAIDCTTSGSRKILGNAERNFFMPQTAV